MVDVTTGKTALKNSRKPYFPEKPFGWMVPFASLIMILTTGSCNKNEPVPVAMFTYAAGNEYKIPCTVNFINQSVESSSSAWWFGTDSSITTISVPGSIDENPTYIYKRSGTFDVTLRAYSESRQEWATMIQTITIRDTVK